MFEFETVQELKTNDEKVNSKIKKYKGIDNTEQMF